MMCLERCIFMIEATNMLQWPIKIYGLVLSRSDGGHTPVYRQTQDGDKIGQYQTRAYLIDYPLTWPLFF